MSTEACGWVALAMLIASILFGILAGVLYSIASTKAVVTVISSVSELTPSSSHVVVGDKGDVTISGSGHFDAAMDTAKSGLGHAVGLYVGGTISAALSSITSMLFFGFGIAWIVMISTRS